MSATTIDTRDLAKRLEELRDDRQSLEHEIEELEAAADGTDQVDLEEARKALDAFDDGEQGGELTELEELESEISEWRHGETMILASDFEEYAQELAEDIGAVNSDNRWPNNCIDWERASRELAHDYSVVSYQGSDYYVRN